MAEPPAQKLPRGWEKHTDEETGEVYYWHNRTGKTQKEFPYDNCGTMGCILKDRHLGLCEIPQAAGR